ncbi:phosphoribosylformylglycinamidine synthase subunit PurL [Mesorhizobium sp. M2D.F.Ca.ET.185.01.1.1]|uniref:phosphoribosylformylglycinamidine synthase subunit PurL n=1 Tax=unclassified Mesorhizobium TaxID=325217 RepID=UPI000FCCD2AC|nr:MULTISPECIES: phosphoribosylformylglycinamidine synthase subunit PurL [unclassified Mesorhizobium]TGU02047.1 phosphoribosylformylglycinamidine synthase subunit PurL [bacterium M00.F.Ca.ET.163.01.1.1]TGU46930.1 phosphoribosylformylglycinamidine synthase subunit PurL [bacterium M00.F.Ca.ET.146.01.1.1]TGW12842.1 phosphoribosylformylglycinamidine synthase subunit PurL [Mesorhizobium sp. M2D.F.Ca.ET.145.01.1.1]TGP33461.1 phosphoribosylformylglycinamidine synthase subunit PurL [Mesorhizobium sp. M
MTISNSVPITPELVAAHGLKPDEYQRILDLVGREPSFTELGIFSAMWNEHCSYKSSKKWLRTLPTSGPQVIQGPGENAGVVDIGDGDCVVFKMESHNHPSYIEPYQGAATGVGGILRDVFTMGARPVAAMNALRFGAPDHPKTRHLVAGVVSGVGGYGNSFGVPTVGGEVNFDARYNGNILVNAFAAGLAKTNAIFLSQAKGAGLPVVYLGAKTGRDGVGGATMASAEFDDKIEEKRPTVQVGDPFTEKCLLEACLELMASGAVIAIQDMGAAGLTCSAVEMGAKGDLGIELDLDQVPVREERMSAYEMMLSESQERMLMVLRPEKEEEAEAIFRKWGLDFAIVGRTTDDLRFRVIHQGDEVANLPIKELGDQAPEYDRSWVEAKKPAPLAANDAPKADVADALLKMLGGPDLSSRRWVWEQYDTLIQGNSLQLPGGDAGVVRVEGHPTKALAFSSDVTPRYCEADPYEGGKQAVAECWRNLTATGALPLAATDNLNFGNPERPEIMGQFVGAVKGIGDACRALGFPIVSGNVSLYNETNGRGILPTPTIGGVGLIADWSKMARIGFAAEGQMIVLVGAPPSWGSHLGQSVYMRDIHGRADGPPPPVDLAHEKRVGDHVRSLIASGIVTAAHDVSDGGLAVALAEMAMASGIGAAIPGLTGADPIPVWFGEDQGRYLLTLSIDPQSGEWDRIREEQSKLGIFAPWIGTTGGHELKLGGTRPIPVSELKTAHEGWFPRFMDQAS